MAGLSADHLAETRERRPSEPRAQATAQGQHWDCPGLTPLDSERWLEQRASEQEGCTLPEPWLCSVPFCVPNLSPRQVLTSAFAICPFLQAFCGHHFLQNEAIADTQTGLLLGRPRHPRNRQTRWQRGAGCHGLCHLGQRGVSPESRHVAKTLERGMEGTQDGCFHGWVVSALWGLWWPRA